MKRVAISILQTNLRYDPKTGLLWWVKTGSGRIIGKPAGFRRPRYHYLLIEGKLFLAHRVIWALHSGQWPKNQIDHINSLGHDNRWINLREATLVQNRWNHRPKKNKSGLKGMYWSNYTKRWCVGIQCRKKKIYLGSFKNPRDAHEAYARAAKKYHGEFARVS